MAEGYVTAPDGVRLFFETRGSGAEVVVMPGGFHLADDFSYLADGRTLIVYDLRHRGRSDLVTDESKRARGVHHDVEDLEAIRRHFGLDAMALVGHSYIALMVVLYAVNRPAHVARIVQLSPMEPFVGKPYAAHLMCHDEVRLQTLVRLGELQSHRERIGPPEGGPHTTKGGPHAMMTSVEFCRAFWTILRPLYVANPADAGRIRWDRCDLPNEVNFMAHWTGSVLPSLQALKLTPAEGAKAAMPVLIVHGRKDRSAPYGGAREWGLLLPDARLITVDRAAHAPWVEAPDQVCGPIAEFLEGRWPATARQVDALDPDPAGFVHVPSERSEGGT
jgi:proline iminopeptidase